MNLGRTVTATLALCKKEVLCLLRDIHGLAALFLMPALFILVMTLVLQDALSYDTTPALPSIGVYNAAPQAIGHQQLQRKLEKQLHVKPYASEAALRTAVLQQEVKVGLLLRTEQASPSAASAPENALLPLQLQLWVDDMTPPAVVATVRGKVTQIWGQQLPSLLTSDGDALTKVMMQLNAPSEQLAQPSVAITTRHQLQSGHTSPPVQRSVPGWLAFGMFFVVLPLSAVFVRERQQGTLHRLRLLQVPLASLLAAKWLCYGAVNLLQVAVMLAVGLWVAPLFGAQPLSLAMDWPALFVMVSAVSMSAVGLALVIAAWSRSTEQATTIGGALNVILGALGGIMVPKMVMPVSMQGMTLISPLGWAYEGLSHIFLGGTAWSEWLPFAGALAALGLVAFGVALWRLQWLGAAGRA